MATLANPTVPMVHRKPVSGYAPVNAYPPQPQATAAAQYAVNNMAARNPPSAYPNPPSPYAAPGQSRRTLSNATSSTSSTSNNNTMSRASMGGYGNSIRRSTSSRSNQSASPTSYVALMRKQKATVWCDRAQHQDPRILAAQRQAKMRAVMEVAGGHNHNPQARASTSSSGITGGVRSKIRHHGAPKAKDYGAGNMSGAGVPMRLSATEVDEDESEDERTYHRQTGSRSSMGSSSKPYTSYKGHDNSPPEASPNGSLGDLAEEQTPMPGRLAGQADYFGSAGNAEPSIDAEKDFGFVPGLPKTRQRSDSEHMSADELRRRGSVDDRTMTMSAGRLFVANPDLSD